jgi:molybdopterin converting factor small subunit
MVHVISTMGEVAIFTGGAAEFDVPAETVGELFAALEHRYPGLGDFAAQRMAVAIDGVIYQDAMAEPLAGVREVCLIPKIGGG